MLAADATSAALLTGSLRQLLLAGYCLRVGLAFQAKMIQAWLVLPALAAAYLLAAPAARLRTRCAHVALAGLVAVVVSLCWMTAVSLWSRGRTGPMWTAARTTRCTRRSSTTTA